MENSTIYRTINSSEKCGKFQKAKFLEKKVCIGWKRGRLHHFIDFLKKYAENIFFKNFQEFKS